MATPRAALHRDLEQRFRDLEAEVRRLASKSLRRDQLSVTGGQFAIDGGDFVLLDTDGSVLFRVGVQEQGDRGVSINRDDGSEAFACKRSGTATVQQLVLRDTQGHPLLAEAALGADGHEEPFLPIPVQPVGPSGTAPTCGPYGFERATTSATFQGLYRAQYRRENPYTRWQFKVFAATGTNAQLQVIDKVTGIGLRGFFQPSWVGTITGNGTWQTIDPPYGLFAGDAAAYGADASLEVQAKRTAGTGTVTVCVLKAGGGPA